MLQVLALSAVGIAAGIVAGAGFTPLVASLVDSDLPVPPRLGLYPGPLLLAGALGFITSVLCMLWPSVGVARVSGAALFRHSVVSARVPLSALMTRGLTAVTAALVAALLGLAFVGHGLPSVRAVLCWRGARLTGGAGGSRAPPDAPGGAAGDGKPGRLGSGLALPICIVQGRRQC